MKKGKEKNTKNIQITICLTLKGVAPSHPMFHPDPNERDVKLSAVFSHSVSLAWTHSPMAVFIHAFHVCPGD